MGIKHFGRSNKSSGSSDPPHLDWTDIRSIKPNPRNARTHSVKQIERIAESIQKFGFLNPIIVDDGGMVLAGHGRLEAARRKGFSRVPVIRFDHLSEAQKRAYVLADNKIAEQAGWDREILALELGELIELLPTEDLDVSLTGFEAAEVDLLLADMGDAHTTLNDIVPAPPDEPVTQRGDVWILGKHRLMCGDARDRADLGRLMEGSSAQAVFCDPPYNVRVSSIGGRGRVRHSEFAFASGEMSSRQYRTFLTQTLGNAVGVSADGAIQFVCMDWRHVGDLIEVGTQIYDAMLNLVVWNKTNGGQGSLYRSQHELIGVFRAGQEPHRNNIELGRHGRNRSNVWTYAGVNSFGKGRREALSLHPTVKPVALVADALLDCTSRGDVVLDHFAGSGTTILAAEKVGRVVRALEYEPRYVDVAIQRWQMSTKRDALLEVGGRTFEEIAEENSDSKLGVDHRASRLSSGATRSKSSSRPQSKDRDISPRKPLRAAGRGHA